MDERQLWIMNVNVSERESVGRKCSRCRVGALTPRFLVLTSRGGRGILAYATSMSHGEVLGALSVDGGRKMLLDAFLN